MSRKTIIAAHGIEQIRSMWVSGQRLQCQNCARWNLANARPAETRLAIRQDEDYRDVKPPHANLLWSQCRAAAEGFENDDAEQEARLYGGKMAVFDGSAYMAELWTRFDHFCGEYRRRLEGEE